MSSTARPTPGSPDHPRPAQSPGPSHADFNPTAFATAIDDIRRRTQAAVGAEDLQYIRNVDRVSRVAELFGRTMIALAPGPLGFTVGVASLWVFKQLQATEIGHSALHGAYNRIPDAGRFHSHAHRWQIPIDEESWMRGHNGRHHGLTNVAGHDPDIHFGPVRLTEHTPHRFIHYLQLPFTLLVLFPNFAALMNVHFTGVTDVWAGNGRADEFDFIEDRSWSTIRDAHWRLLRKYLRYYATQYLLWPAVFGVVAGLVFGWWLAPIVVLRSIAGNFIADTLRDIYSAATIYCGHVGEHTSAWPEGTMPANKGERYAMQTEATNNFEVPWIVSLFCGALDLQIEHHLFPTLPPNRLREVAPQVRAACAEHGVQYRSASWPRTLGRALAQVARLSRKLPHERQPAAPFAEAQA